MKKLLTLFIFCFALMPLAQASDLKEGVHYKTVGPVATDSGDKIEILEFFWYGCPHCYTFEPYITEWKQSKPANVEFIQVPAVFRPSWKVHARAFYALQAMGKLDDLHEKIFKALHKDRIKLNSMDQVANFVSKNGVDKEAFIKQYRSFSIDAKVRKANKLVKDYKVTGVPFVAINGKYVTDGRTAGSYERMIQVIDQLIASESK